MYNGQKGLRCQICTGCGLCPGVARESRGAELHVLTENALWSTEEARQEHTASNQEGQNRLATADVGTTTIAMQLFRADGTVEDRFVAVNPQTAYGADVISRIRTAEDKAKAAEMQRQVKAVLEQGLRRFEMYLSPGDSIQLNLAANTTMTYLLMGWDTSELGCAPFRASCLKSIETEIGGVACHVFPGVSAFVGGDITAGMYACDMEKCQELTLLIDLGTNGEIVLGNRDRRIACATAAGPAFEGGVNRGIWGADMVHLLAELRREKLLDETGLLAEPYFDKGIRIGNVCVTKEAVRSVQLAKAAIAAGIDILMKKYGISEEQVERVVLAGGFGYYLNPLDAAEIGLLPRALAAKAVAGGNTALTGAAKAGRKSFAMRELEELAAGTEVLNLAEEPEFAVEYVNRMELKSLGTGE